jgi:hypothetical protein
MLRFGLRECEFDLAGQWRLLILWERESKWDSSEVDPVATDVSNWHNLEGYVS